MCHDLTGDYDHVKERHEKRNCTTPFAHCKKVMNNLNLLHAALKFVTRQAQIESFLNCLVSAQCRADDPAAK